MSSFFIPDGNNDEVRHHLSPSNAIMPGSDGGVITLASDIIVDICVIDDHPFVIVQEESIGRNSDDLPRVSSLLLLDDEYLCWNCRFSSSFFDEDDVGAYIP